MQTFKRVACLSSTRLMESSSEGLHQSKQVMSIFNLMRTYHKHHQVNGALVVYQSTILLLLEGSSETLADAIYKLGRDQLLIEKNLLFNSTESSPAFTNWRIKMVDKAKDQAYLTSLQRLVKQHLPSATLNKDPRLAALFEPAIPKGNTFDGSYLFLKTKPSAQLPLTPQLKKLCTLLSKRKMTIEQISVFRFYASEALLKKDLEKLHAEGLLGIKSITIQQAANKVDRLQKEASKPKNKADKFSQVLRKFLLSQKKAG